MIPAAIFCNGANVARINLRAPVYKRVPRLQLHAEKSLLNTSLYFSLKYTCKVHKLYIGTRVRRVVRNPFVLKKETDRKLNHEGVFNWYEDVFLFIYSNQKVWDIVNNLS